MQKPRVLVPTMGALHKAHGELIRVAREAAGKDGEVAVSIFVNPLQFEPGSDYKRYPRPEKADEEFCRNAGVDLLFRPVSRRKFMRRIARYSSKRLRFRARWKANRAPDIFAVFAQWWRSCSTFSRRTRRCSARRIFSNWRSFAGWCAISISRSTSSPCRRCGRRTDWHAVRAISI